ncbi:MAG: DUF1697 domain-containing protein [Deltaproteobacteria bacterium]
MTRYVLLLRGINVGGAGKLPMVSLRDLLSGIGCLHVATYIQSGNAVFAADLPREELVGSIQDAIEAAHGFRPYCLLLTEGELAAALTANPWPEAEGDEKPMHLIFHDGSAKADTAALEALLAADEQWKLTETVLYFRAPQGIGRSKFIEKLARYFKAQTTGRNLRSCEKLLAMVREIP